MKTHQTIEEIRRDTERLQEQIDARKAERVSLGLPPDRPADFVKTEHAAEMVKRVQPVYETLTRYLLVLNESKKPVPFPVERFDSYRDLLTLIEWAVDNTYGLYGGALRASIELMADTDTGYERTVTGLHRYLKFARGCQELSDVERYGVEPFKGTDEELDAIIADYQRHYTEVVEPQITHEKAVLEAAGKGKNE